MWRWIHSLPRAVRHQFHGTGVSAGVHVEEHHEVGVEKDNVCRWKFYNKQKQRTSDANHEKHYSKPQDTNEYWRSVQTQQAFVDAVGLGGVVALGIDVYRFKCLQKTYQKLEDGFKHGFSSSTAIHALPRVNKSRSNSKVVNDTTVDSTELNEKKPNFVKANAFSDDNIEDFDAIPTCKCTSKKVVTETSPKQESLEEAFQNFNDICQKYTAIGKGIMGNQEALKQNYKAAAEHWEESSQLGHAKSHFNLAVCYETGTGVKKDLKEAVRLYKLAAEDLHPQAMYNLGILYMDGTQHTPKHLNKGLELVTLAADFGLSEAQCYLGIYYTNEENEDSKKAVHYLTLSANHKNTEAEYSLALCYQHGYGVEENMCKAASLFSKAADKQHPEALYSLAVFYRDGLGGLPKDIDYSKELMKQAADNGCEEAINEIQNSVKESQGTEDKNNLIHSCASSPCLTDLLRQNMITIDSTLLSNPVSKEGSLTQLCSQLLVPRGFTLKDSITKTSGTSNTGLLNKNTMSTSRKKDKKSKRLVQHNIDSDNNEDMDSDVTCSSLYRRTSTMPDLSVIPCI
ncbi:hypothetical protein ACF0H5_010397 [Mactra antiquata]